MLPIRQHRFLLYDAWPVVEVAKKADVPKDQTVWNTIQCIWSEAGQLAEVLDHPVRSIPAAFAYRLPGIG